MNESRNNPIAKENASGELPMTSINIQIITKLAGIGLNFLNSQIPVIKELIEKGQSQISAEQLEEFEFLSKEGAESIKHFNAICQYLHDKEENKKN